MASNDAAIAMNKEVEEQPHAVDPEIANRFQSRLEREQNLFLGIIAGIGAAILGAAIWATVTVATEYQIGWMAVGVGFLVGYAVRLSGKGISGIFGIIGAACALIGCILGNLFSACGFMAAQESVPLLQVVVNTLMQPGICIALLKITFSPMDLLFYGIAAYEGYKFSFRQITQQELAQLAPQE
jgi:hypothetical protein